MIRSFRRTLVPVEPGDVNAHADQEWLGDAIAVAGQAL
jgi:hypothetical protein